MFTFFWRSGIRILLKIRFIYWLSWLKNLHANQPTGEHFNLPGHELNHLKVKVLEKNLDLGRYLLEVWESKYIRDFMTEFRGMNRKKIVFI